MSEQMFVEDIPAGTIVEFYHDGDITSYYYKKLDESNNFLYLEYIDMTGSHLCDLEATIENYDLHEWKMVFHGIEHDKIF